MAKKSKLLTALDEHKGVDHKLEKQKKLQKQAAKRKRLREQKNLNGENDQFGIKKPLMSGALPAEADDDPECGSEDGSNASSAVVQDPFASVQRSVLI